MYEVVYYELSANDLHLLLAIVQKDNVTNDFSITQLIEPAFFDQVD